ncbi:MAG TPA: penicillin-binding transpeptidase domain-containing protein [Longimicrobiales bacterium]
MRRRIHNHGRRRRLLLAGLVLWGLVLLGRVFQLQVVEGERWAARAAEQHRQRVALPAPRGTIYDRDGVPLAASHEAYRIAIAPHELKDRRGAAKLLREVLGLSPQAARRAVGSRRRWVVLPGRYDAGVKERLESVRGVYFERVLERFYPHGGLALELLGRVSADQRALGGLELELDSLLRGRPGTAVVRRDARGEPIPGALISVEEPVPGHDVYLTIDYDLQEIADEALRHAMAETGATGGDIVITDPRSGEILAAVSRRAGRARPWTGVTEPYEPGSTLKPFIVAALLEAGRATFEDSVYAEEGRYVDGRRTISDVHPYGWLTLREALRYSSNIAMVKMARRLEPESQYAYLRDFGFGSPTGVRYPSESSGVLRRPADWSGYSQASLAMGYEISVTPLQMVMAYGALANGGVLMEPRLVREVRSRDGRVRAEYAPRAVRRVVSREVARAVAEALAEVVEEGTGHEASLGTFQVAGKTGTARRVSAGRYEPGAYTASFAGFFPADDPQLVVLVKLDRPRGDYYGGLTAAPVTRATLAAALAARSTPLDRRAVAQRAAPAAPGPAGVRFASLVQDDEARGALAGDPYVFVLDGAPAAEAPPAVAAARPVPEVAGLPLRDAVRRLHALGFHVRVEGSGPVRGTEPAAGTPARPGEFVRVLGVGR